ncbi:MAG: GMC family oxidoreductase [Acidimicrobiia bacterium]
MAPSFDADVIVVGSGFGGSVSALRLTEKGYRVLVLEAGRRFGPDDFAKSSWELNKFLWAPRLGMRGIQRIDLLHDALVLSGAGVGGGSLVYSNTLIEPNEEFFTDPQWSDITDWKAEMAPWYDLARRMLGVEPANGTTPADDVIASIAEHFGQEHTHHPVPVGVYRGIPGETVEDPYFGGVGPTRTGCIECGGCMVGCRFNAKNTLDKTYLYLAEQAGATVLPDSKVVDLVDEGQGWRVSVGRPGSWFDGSRRTYRARKVVLSAGGLGTTKLLLRLRERGRLPHISARLGELVRTNSEAIVGAVARSTRVDYSKGVAITSAFQADEHTRIEPVRYPKGSSAMGLLATILVEGGEGPQFVRFFRRVMAAPRAFFRSLSLRRWAERGLIILVMQSIDNSIRLTVRKGWFGPRIRSMPGHGRPSPRWLPVAHEAAAKAAEAMDGEAAGSVNESLFGIPATAHLIGGAVIGASPVDGVVDPYHRVFGHPTLSVVDGAAVPANLGANPSLSITAMAERAMAAWPNKGDEDARPPVGEAYRRVEAVVPRHPVVPAGAPAEMRV